MADERINITPLCGAEINSLLNLWNRSVPTDPISLNRFETRILLDPNVSRDGILTARVDQTLVGFAVTVLPQFALPRDKVASDRCFVLMFGVSPDYRRKGVATALFDHLERLAEEKRRTSIAIAPYPAGYLIPGVDKDNHVDAIAFLEKRGYMQHGEDSLAMEAQIALYTVPEEIIEKEEQLRKEGIAIRPYRRTDILDVMEFMAETMPPDWTENYARRNLRALPAGGFMEDQLMLAFDGERIIGFCQFEGEHFGPFGVADGYQGRGIGTVLLSRTLEKMWEHEAHGAWVLWTGERAAKGVYSRLGFSVTRRFAIMVKPLSTQR